MQKLRKMPRKSCHTASLSFASKRIAEMEKAYFFVSGVNEKIWRAFQ